MKYKRFFSLYFHNRIIFGSENIKTAKFLFKKMGIYCDDLIFLKLSTQIYGITINSKSIFKSCLSWLARILSFGSMICGLIICILAVDPTDNRIDQTIIFINSYIANLILLVIFVFRMNKLKQLVSKLISHCTPLQQKELVRTSQIFAMIFSVSLVTLLIVPPIFFSLVSKTPFKSFNRVVSQQSAPIFVIFVYLANNIYVYGMFDFSIFFCVFLNLIIEAIVDQSLVVMKLRFFTIKNTIDSVGDIKWTQLDINQVEEKTNENVLMKQLTKFSQFKSDDFLHLLAELHSIIDESLKSIELILFVIYFCYFNDTILRISFSATNDEVQSSLAIIFSWLLWLPLTGFMIWLCVLIDRIYKNIGKIQGDMISLIGSLESNSLEEYDRKQFIISNIELRKISPPTGNGYFEINKGLILSFANAVITFSVMILNLSDKN